MTPNDYKQGMRHLASAVSIITTQMDGKPAGMTATAVCSLTAEPPMLLICINKAATTHTPIHTTGRFAVNCLSRNDLGVAQHFCVGTMLSRFQIGAWRVLPSGGIVLDSALVTFDCRLQKHVEVATHTIFIGEVEDVIVFPERRPLVYVNGRYGEVVAHGHSNGSRDDPRL